MKARVLVAMIGVPVLILILGYAPYWATTVLMMALCGLGAHELMHAVCKEQGKKQLMPMTAVTAAMLPAFVQAEQTISWEKLAAMPKIPLLEMLAVLFVFLLFLAAILNYGQETAISFSALTAAIFAGLVFPLMLSCMLRLRLTEYGMILVFVPLGISFGSDTFALFAGLLFGRHKLTPVSPKKTVEGAVGGLLGGVIGLLTVKIAALVLLGLPFLTWGQLLFIGLVGSAVSQIGDLSFSVIKREFGVKDYGKLLPGHGGVLDRFDSVTFVSPFVWVMLSAFI